MTGAHSELYRRDQAKALGSAEKSVAYELRDWRALALLRNADLQANQARTARLRYARAFPELLSQQPPAVDPSNVNAAVDLLFVLQRTGERARAAQLLDLSEAQFLTMPRMGPWGYGVADAQVHSLRGDKAKALAALRESCQGRLARSLLALLPRLRPEPRINPQRTRIQNHLRRHRARHDPAAGGTRCASQEDSVRDRPARDRRRLKTSSTSPWLLHRFRLPFAARSDASGCASTHLRG